MDKAPQGVHLHEQLYLCDCRIKHVLSWLLFLGQQVCGAKAGCFSWLQNSAGPAGRISQFSRDAYALV